MVNRNIISVDATPTYEGTLQTLGNILVDEEFVPEEFFISDEELPLVLPLVDDYGRSKDGKSPLEKATDWVNVKYNGVFYIKNCF